MWEWTASILEASANIANGIINALANSGSPYIGIAMAALIGGMGAAQIGTIIANKPIPPQFAKGGFVGGTSYAGDRVSALVNSGEVILNPAQQKQFMNIANGMITSNSLGGINVEIHNSASNIVRAEPQMTESGLQIIIDKVVGSSISNGTYNQQLRVADGTQYGTAYTS